MFDVKNEDRSVLLTHLKKAASNDIAVAAPARAELAKAIELPIRQTLLSGDIVSDIFTPEDFSDPTARVEYPVDFLTPGQEREFYAYVIPQHGALPERRVEGDYVMIPTYQIGNSIDCTTRFLQNANWPVLARMVETLEAGFVKKMNDDGWQTLLAAAIDRNILVNDPNATQGQFTPRIITLLKSIMRRNGGGNSGTKNRAKVTDIYLSPEGIDDIRAWGIDLIPDAVRARIFDTSDENGDLLKIFGVNLHGLDEFGEGQEYQQYYTSTLAGTMAGSDVEICVAVDKQRKDSFVRPWRSPVEIFEDSTTHRRRIFSLYGWAENGWAVLDSRRVMLGSF